MATKPPKLTFEAFKDKREAVEIWLDQFNDWCILQSWRDTSKPTSDHDHWKEDCYAKEISAFRLGMPPEVLRNIKTTVVPMMGNDDTAADALDRYSGYPWVWQKLVLRHYSGQDTVLAERMTFLDTCKQKPHETIAEFEARCKYHGRRCEYSSMNNPEEELIRDRFVTGVRDDKLRAELLRHKKRGRNYCHSSRSCQQGQGLGGSDDDQRKTRWAHVPRAVMIEMSTAKFRGSLGQAGAA